MEQASLEGRIAALEKYVADHATWHAWDQKARKLRPAFEYRDGEHVANALKFTVFGACRFAWFLVRCAVMYEVGRFLLSGRA